MGSEPVRIQKYLSDAGICSRRSAENAVTLGKVTVNGEKASIGQKVNYDDYVEYYGKPVEYTGEKAYYMLYKPCGYVTTLKDEQGKKCIADLIEGIKERVYPIGRLDRASEGLLLLTNDGNFAEYLTHPRYHVEKTYIVVAKGNVDEEAIKKLRAMRMLDGEPIKPVEVEAVRNNKMSTTLKFKLHQGKNRQIRRMCSACGVDISSLKRISIGRLRLGKLLPGEYVRISKKHAYEIINDQKHI